MTTANDEMLRWVCRPRGTFDTHYDADLGALWLWARHSNTVCWTPQLLKEVNEFGEDLRALYRNFSWETPPVRYVIGGSLRPGVFNLGGGDLAFFLKCVRDRDTTNLRLYAHGCVSAILGQYNAWGCPVVPIALVEGVAMGGGFEAALSAQFIFAAGQAQFSFPESLFKTFPGMGALSILSRRLGNAAAEKMVYRHQVYGSEELRNMGLVHKLVGSGEGAGAVRAFMQVNSDRHSLLVAQGKARREVNPLTFAELEAVVEIWIGLIMDLPKTELRRMERIAASQTRFALQQSA